MSLQTLSVTFFVAYLIFVTFVAWWSSRGAGSGAADVEYYLGGHSTPTVVLAFSYVTSSVSAAAFMGDPGVMSTIGWPYYWVVIGVIPGLILPAVLLMRRLRMQADKLGSLTIPEYLGQRYNSKALQLIIAGVISVFYIFPLVAQFKGGAILLESFTGISFDAGLFLITAIIIFYVIAGGLRSVAWTDFVQGFPMLIISIALLIVSLQAVGGFSGLEDKLAAINPDMLRVVEPSDKADAQMTISGIIGNFVFWCVIFISQPYLCSRFLAIPNVSRKTIGVFLITALVLTVIYNSFYIAGLTGRVLFPDADPDHLTVTMAINLLPNAMAALMMIGIFAAMISTATSILLVVGQAIGRDFYAKTFNKNASPEKEVFATRIAVTVIAIACMLFNYTNPPHFLSIFLYLGLSGIGSCIGVPLFTGIVSDRGTKEGAIASSIAGPAAYMTFTYAFGVNFWVSCLLAVLVAALMMIGISAIVHRKRAMACEIAS
ncbi:MAG: sodium/solute symporter [Selenomonadaceae bacterium]|nr:sodium/solute symporter [Selenomonadaceae bacterium]